MISPYPDDWGSAAEDVAFLQMWLLLKKREYNEERYYRLYPFDKVGNYHEFLADWRKWKESKNAW